MFAIALWDDRDRRLVLARDRLGIKPLMYYDSGTFIAFASEMSSLLSYGDIPRDIDPEALHLYLAFEYVPAPRTILKGVKKLPPATILSYKECGEVNHATYWQYPDGESVRIDESEATEKFRDLLDQSVKRRMMSDVPFGAFLSGGIDSSSIVALMSQHVSQPVKTFSIGFDDQSYDELSYAREVAEQLGTDHHEEILRPEPDSWLKHIVEDHERTIGGHVDDSNGTRLLTRSTTRNRLSVRRWCR